jgi:hypothetical protein
MLAHACGDSQDGQTSSSTISDSAGIRIVTSNAGVREGQGLRIDTVPIVRIGSDENGPYQFTIVRRGLLLDDGVIAVAELATNEVRFFDADGRHLRSLGRKGNGPGEFEYIASFLNYPGDSLVVYDQMLRRSTIIATRDVGYRVVRTQAQGNLDAFGVFASGQLALYNPGSFRRDLKPGLQWDTTDIVLVDPADGASRVITRLPSRQLYYEPGDRRRLAPTHRAIQAGTEDGFYWATSDRSEIGFYDAEGNLRRILRRPVEPGAVTSAQVERWIEANLEDVRRFEGEAAIARYRPDLERAYIGDRVPLFERAFVDRNGGLWLGESVWPEIEGVPRRWSLFDPEGRFLGELNTPPNLGILDVRDDLLLGVSQEPGEAPFVQVHRLHRP